MKTVNIVTKEIVLETKKYLGNKTLKLREVGLLVGVSQSTVSRIKAGEYDYLFEQQQTELPLEDDTKNVNVTNLDYKELSRLLISEFSLNELAIGLFNHATLNKNNNEKLYFPPSIIDDFLQRNFTSEYHEKLEQLKAGEEY